MPSEIPGVSFVGLRLAATAAILRERRRPPLIERLRGPNLEGQLRTLEQPFQPSKDLRVGQRQLFERTVPDLWGQLIELLVEGGGECLLELLLDLRVDPPQMVDGPRLGADPPGLVEDLARDPRDSEQALRVQSEPRGGDHIGGRRRIFRRFLGFLGHRRRLQRKQGLTPRQREG